MKVQAGILLVYTCALLALSGCANTYKVRQVQFSEPTPPAQDETLIYVFRENSFYGSARKFSIICNDTIKGVLTPGTFCNFKVRSGENEIVAYMSPSPLMHHRVQDQPGKTVYLFCKVGYATGMFMEEIDENESRKLMKEFKYTEIEIKNQKARMNYKDYYGNLYR